jgi:hypothetical protein
MKKIQSLKQLEKGLKIRPQRLERGPSKVWQKIRSKSV